MNYIKKTEDSDDIIEPPTYKGFNFKPIPFEYEWYDCELCNNDHTIIEIKDIDFRETYYEWIDNFNEYDEISDDIIDYIKELVDNNDPKIQKYID